MVAGVDALVVLVAVWTPSQAWLGALAAIAGSMLGSITLFFIARKGDEEYLHRHTSRGRGARLRAWFDEYGLITVFVPALVVIPMPLKLFVLSAGAMEVKPIRFSLVLLLARIPRYFFLAWLGTQLGTETLPYLRGHVWELLAFAVVLTAALYFSITLFHRHRTSARSK
jgi:membrane protein YqaA with SNARE-associated domain